MDYYDCQCKGCPNGEGSRFEAASEKWWIDRGMTPPKNCPTCRDWIDKQVDEEIRCSQCQGPIRLPARYKITYHKRIGVYTRPLLCTTCTWRKKRGEPPLQRLTRAQHLRVTVARVEERREEHKGGPLPSSYDISTNPADYQHLVYNPLISGQELRQVHVEHHAVWSPHSWVSHGKSPTYLGIAKQNFQALLRDAAAIARETDPSKVMEIHRDCAVCQAHVGETDPAKAAEPHMPNGNVAKIDLATGEKIIIDPNDGKLVSGFQD